MKYTSKITVYQYGKPAKGKSVSLGFNMGFSKKVKPIATGWHS